VIPPDIATPTCDEVAREPLLLSALVLVSCCLSAKIPNARHSVCSLSALPLDSTDQSITHQRAHKTIEQKWQWQGDYGKAEMSRGYGAIEYGGFISLLTFGDVDGDLAFTRVAIELQRYVQKCRAGVVGQVSGPGSSHGLRRNGTSTRLSVRSSLGFWRVEGSTRSPKLINYRLGNTLNLSRFFIREGH
jgi:hypothetical protein